MLSTTAPVTFWTARLGLQRNDRRHSRGHRVHPTRYVGPLPPALDRHPAPDHSGPLATNSTQPVQYEDIYFTPLGIGSIPPAPPPTTGLPNWPINLENSSGQVIASTVTDAHGNYYSIMSPRAPIPSPKSSRPAGPSLRPPSPGTYSVTVTSDQVIAGLDFGNSENNPPAVDPGPVFPSSYAGDTNATVGQKYTYTAVAADTDHDQITYSLGLAARHGHRPDPGRARLDTDRERGRFPERRHRGQRRRGNIATQDYTYRLPADSRRLSPPRRCPPHIPIRHTLTRSRQFAG